MQEGRIKGNPKENSTTEYKTGTTTSCYQCNKCGATLKMSDIENPKSLERVQVEDLNFLTELAATEDLNAILQQIAVWIGYRIIKEGIIEGIHAFLLHHMDEWREYVRDLTERGLEWGLEELAWLHSRIMEAVKQNRDELRRCISASITAGSKLAAKATRIALTTAVTQSTTAAAAKCLTTSVSEMAGTATTKSVTTSTIVASELVGEQVMKTAATSTTGMIAKAANPVGFASDFVQAGLEVAGYKKTGKAVGATGNVISGAMTGFACGGPVGAAVGGAAGFGVWTLGEGVGMLTSKVIERAQRR